MIFLCQLGHGQKGKIHEVSPDLVAQLAELKIFRGATVCKLMGKETGIYSLDNARFIINHEMAQKIKIVPI